MKDLLEIGMVVGGVSLLILCIASLWIPKVLGWKQKLTVLSPLMREMWWTYAAYVLGSHLFFAILLLGFGDWLMGGSGPAIAMLSFMLLWWGMRLYMLSLLFVGLVLLFALLIWWNLGWRIGLGWVEGGDG